MAAKIAGVKKATPTAKTAAPTGRPTTLATTPSTASATVHTANDPAASLNGGTRSGSRAKMIRQATTIDP
jgi:hypothetical protein